jgi:hypothetical protein
MVTDEELRALSPEQRRDLARRLAAVMADDARVRLARRRRTVLAVAALACVALVCWAGWLSTDLPARYLVGHWDLAWVGFDLLLAGCVGATGVLTWRGSPFRAGAAFATAVLLVCDAWFDVVTATGSGYLLTSVLSAALVELPLAAVTGLLAYRQLRAATLPASTATATVTSAPSSRAAGSPGRSRPDSAPMVAAATGTPS